MKRKVHLILEGHVQGVGFRHYTKNKADELKVAGFAENLQDGSVQVIAQGGADQIEQFVTFVKNGASPSSRVDTCHINELEPDDSAGIDFKTN